MVVMLKYYQSATQQVRKTKKENVMEVVPCVCLHPLEPSAQSGCRWCNLHGSRQLCPRALHLFNR